MPTRGLPRPSGHRRRSELKTWYCQHSALTQGGNDRLTLFHDTEHQHQHEIGTCHLPFSWTNLSLLLIDFVVGRQQETIGIVGTIATSISRQHSTSRPSEYTPCLSLTPPPPFHRRYEPRYRYQSNGSWLGVGISVLIAISRGGETIVAHLILIPVRLLGRQQHHWEERAFTISISIPTLPTLR